MGMLPCASMDKASVLSATLETSPQTKTFAGAPFWVCTDQVTLVPEGMSMVVMRSTLPKRTLALATVRTGVVGLGAAPPR